MKVCDVLKTPDSRISHFILFTFNFITGGRENTQSHIKCIWYTDNILDHVCIWWKTPWQQMASQTPPFLPQMCRKEEKTRCYISPNPALFPLPYCQLNHDVCTTHTQAHKHLLPAAIIPPCMFSCSVKSPSSQVPTHLLNPETACKSHPERKHSIKWKTYLHANGCFGGPLGSEASGPATIVYVRTSGCNAK